jgi:hypothetical protein
MIKSETTTKNYKICDICGKKADGEFSRTTYLNGEVFREDYCPLDLCKNHMRGEWKTFDEISKEEYLLSLDNVVAVDNEWIYINGVKCDMCFGNLLIKDLPHNYITDINEDDEVYIRNNMIERIRPRNKRRF